MSRQIYVFGTHHLVQGPTLGNFPKVNDPDYERHLDQLFLSGKFDFVFEEASDSGPTVAEKKCDKLLGAGRYLDIDREELKGACGIEGKGEDRIAPNLFEANLGVQANRESLWVYQVKNQSFTSALLVCGYVHTLSLAFKLRAEDFCVDASYYVPHSKLCDRNHPGESPSTN